jgi:polyamine oxidase
LQDTYSNYSSILTYDEHGFNDFSNLLDDFEDAYSTLEQMAGTMLSENLQDHSTRSGLSLSGWKPKKDMKKQAVEWWEWG